MQSDEPVLQSEELAELALKRLNVSLPKGCRGEWQHKHGYDDQLDKKIHASQPLFIFEASFTGTEDGAKQEFNVFLQALQTNTPQITPCIRQKKETGKISFGPGKHEHFYTLVLTLEDLIAHEFLGFIHSLNDKTLNRDTLKEKIKSVLLKNDSDTKKMLGELSRINKDSKLGQIFDEIKAELKSAQAKAYDALQESVLKKWIREFEHLGIPNNYLLSPQNNLNDLNTIMTQNKISQDKQIEAYDIFHKYRATSEIKLIFQKSKDCDDLKTMVLNLHKAAEIFEENREHFEKERHPFIRKMFYKVSQILLNLGIGAITSIFCGIHSMTTVGTFDYIQAMDEKRTTGKYQAEKALKIAGLDVSASAKKPSGLS